MQLSGTRAPNAAPQCCSRASRLTNRYITCGHSIAPHASNRNVGSSNTCSPPLSISGGVLPDTIADKVPIALCSRCRAPLSRECLAAIPFCIVGLIGPAICRKVLFHRKRRSGDADSEHTNTCKCHRAHHVAPRSQGKNIPPNTEPGRGSVEG